MTYINVLLSLIAFYHLMLKECDAQILVDSIGSCVQSGCTSCCDFSDCPCFVVNNCYCDNLCLSLNDCCKDIYQLDSCSDSNVTVTAAECTSGSVRLVGGPDSSQGLVEICIFQSWRPVCASSFSYNEANVTCSSLGYSVSNRQVSELIVLSNSSITNGTTAYGAVCQGKESRLTECLVDYRYCFIQTNSTVQQAYVNCSVTATGSCSPACVNGICGSYNTCSCDEGWTGETCNIAICTPECRNGNCTGPNKCQCDTGWTGDRCRQDIDECMENSTICGSLHCENNLGSYRCYCDEGFKPSASELDCEDMNECNDSNAGCSHFCNNTIGSFFCSCPIEGYKLTNSTKCEDIDECSDNIAVCDHGCNNTIGSYYCYCRTGFALDPENGSCKDIDECALGIDSCSDQSENCHNTIGGYLCLCLEGYTKDNGVCKDANECDTSNGGCSHYCNNTEGSYFCSCPSGYLLDDNSYTCIDVDECESSPCDQICINTMGSFQCQCGSGYIVEGSMCEAQPCNMILTSPMNGTLTCNSTVQVTYTQCNTTCDVEFALVGSDSRICQSNAQWSGEQAYCQLRRCPTLFPPSNAFIQLPCSPLYGSTCTVRCFEGYKIALNSSNVEHCEFSEDSLLQWTNDAECTIKPVCEEETCEHGGICTETEGGKDFNCDCTGTLYQGERCERGLLQVSEIDRSELVTSGFTKVAASISALPDKELMVTFLICTQQSGSGVLPNLCKPITFNGSEITKPLELFLIAPGIYSLEMKLEGQSAPFYDQPPPIVLVVRGASQMTPYLDRFGLQLVSGCCTLTSRNSVLGLTCHAQLMEGNEIELHSSCHWTDTDSDTLETAGIVFSVYESLIIPISVSGLLVRLSTNDFQPSEMDRCDVKCNRFAKQIDNPPFTTLDQSVCYIHKPTPDEIIEFVSKQTLAASFLSTVNDKLLPTWLQLSASSNASDTLAIELSDIFIQIEDEVGVVSNSFCSNMVTDSEGHFALLTFRGTISLSLQTAKHSFEDHTLAAPAAGTYYCVAINLCLGSVSPVYIGIPSSAQTTLQNISFISEYTDRGWKFNFVSFIIRNISSSQRNIANHWNGFTTDFHPKNPIANVVASLQASGQFVLGQTMVTINYDGEVRYQYSTSKEVVAEANGAHTVNITTFVYAKKEELILNRLSTSAFIYHNNKTFNCDGEETDGIAWKLDYLPRQGQKFFLSLLSLPYDAGFCQVDIFLNLDSNKEMNGLSFYSSCLDIAYNGLLFAGASFEHKFYFISNTNTLCTNSNLSDQNFGLLVQSSVSDSVPLGKFFELLPDTKAVEMKFSASSQSKTGLVQSVDIAVLGISDNTALDLRDSLLSFSVTGNLFTETLYKASVTGVADTTSTWDTMSINITGLFIGDFPSRVNTAVHDHLMRIADVARVRRNEAQVKVENLAKRFDATKIEFENFKSLADISSKKYDDAVAYETQATMNLTIAEDRLANVTDDLKNAETTLSNLCQLQTCEFVCVPVSKVKTVYDDIFVNVTSECDSTCTKVERVRVAPFNNPTVVWMFKKVCRNEKRVCGNSACDEQVCRFICKSSLRLEPVYNHRDIQITTACKMPCTIQIYNRTVESTEPYIDQCGERLQDANCTARNSACRSRRDAALSLIETKREGLTEPLKLRNEAQRIQNLAQNNLIRARISKNTALQNLEISQIALTQIERLTNFSLANYNAVVRANSQGLRVLDELNNQPVDEIFNITNVTFSVNLGVQSPVVFPINIEFMSSVTSERLVQVTYDFSTIFTTQQQPLVENIVDILFPPSQNRKKRSTQRLKRQTEVAVDQDFGEEQFQVQCIKLSSLSRFLDFMKDSLVEVERERERYLGDVARLFELLQSFKVSENPNIATNFSSLQTLFNVSDEEIEETIQALPGMNVEELESILEIIGELETSALDSESSIDNTLFESWQTRMELIFQENGTVADTKCYGFSDCLLVSLEVFHNLLSFGPQNLGNELRNEFDSIRDEYLELATDSISSIRQANSSLQRISSIVRKMEDNGYWCATPPVITVHPVATVNISVIGTLRLYCEGESTLPLRYRWKKDGVIIAGATSNTFIKKNFHVFDEGNYTCEMSNAVSKSVSINSSVLAYILPEFYLTPVSITTYIGDQRGALFTCNATSRPDPGWIWYFRKSTEEKWVEIDGEETNELLLVQPDEDDIGMYRCLAYNYHGNITSESVQLQLLSATARVASFEVSFSLDMRNISGVSLLNSTGNNLIDTLESILRDQLTINPNELRSIDIDFGQTLKLLLVSSNTTDNRTSSLSLLEIFNSINAAEDSLDGLIDDLRDLVTSNSFVFAVGEEEYFYPRGSFTVNIQTFLCPAGQQLHTNTLLCVDCLKGQYQVTALETRFVEGRTIRQNIPRCSLCPINTYNNKIGGAECISCPEGHITLSAGAVTEEQCIRGCSLDSSEGSCEGNPCLLESCPAFPDAECIPDECGGCTARWFNDGVELTQDQCRQCPFEGQTYKSCIRNCFPSCTEVQPICSDPTCPNPGCECSNGQLLDTAKGKCVDRTECDTCSLPANSGPCMSMVPQWSFNSASGQCERFLYGGCSGNDNRFNTLTSCIQKCGCGPDKALVACIGNPCQSAECPAYPNARCEVDTCGNCSAKFFNGLEEVTDMCEICRLPIDVGLCQGSVTRFSFNALLSRCERFSYTGCEGNRNNFETLQKCIQSCSDVCPPNKQPVTCLINACDVSFCPLYPNAQCFSSNCGGCNAVFYDKNDKDVTALCEQCPEDRPALQCAVNVCKYQTCPERPMAECRVDVCGQCDKAGFFIGDEEVTNNCSLCPAEGQVFHLKCPSSCLQTCDSYGKQLECPDECTPGCYCPAGKVLDEVNNKCVDPSECPCPVCDPLPDNCTDIVKPSSNETCGCPICRACPVEGQVYQDCKTCPVTCAEPDISCSQVCVLGCGCPEGEVIDEELNKCVRATECPEPDPCTLPADRGDCLGRIVRYYFNSDTQRCEEFYWGGCDGNENRFNYLHECEKQCSVCPPTCTPNFCLTNRKATCSVPGVPSDASCPSGCVISNCQACYYSYAPLPLPKLESSCPTSCIDAGEIDKSCLVNWGRCVRRGFTRTYPKIPISARTLSNYRCWKHPCFG